MTCRPTVYGRVNSLRYVRRDSEITHILHTLPRVIAPVTFARRPRFHMHFTPTSASWLNLVERWFALLTEKQLRRGVHQSSSDLEAAIYQYMETTNKDPKPFVWTKTADQILANVARFCQRTLDSVH